MYHQNFKTIPPIKISQTKMKLYFYPYGRFISIFSICWLLLFILPGSILCITRLLSLLAVISVCWVIFMLIVFAIVLLMKLFAPTDEEFDEWLEYQRDMLYRRAMHMSGLIQIQIEAGLCLQGGISKDTYNSWYSKYANQYKSFRYKKSKKDGKTRFSVNLFTHLFLTQDKISIFSSGVDAFNQSKHIEEMQHYYYEHVMGILACDIRETTQFANQQSDQLYNYRFFLRLVNGEPIGIDTMVNMYLIEKGGKVVRGGSIDQIVLNLLYLIRDHKQAAIKGRVKVSP